MTSSKRNQLCRAGIILTTFAATALATLAAPAEVQAQACCAATGAGEFAVVGRCQSAVIGTQISAFRPTGTYSGDGDYRSLSNAEVDDFILSVGGGFRPFSPSWQVYGSAPMHLQYRAFAGEDGEVGVGLGDVAGGLRWTAFEDTMEGIVWDKPATLIPFVDVYIDALAPSGRGPDDSEKMTGADVTGGGFWQVTGGLKITKFLLPSHALTLNTTYALPFAREVAQSSGTPIDFARGQALTVQFSYLYIHNLFWSWGLTSSVKVEGDARIDGAALSDSGSRRLRFGGHMTHEFGFPFWEASLSVMMDSVWQDGGSNIPYVGPAATVGLRRNFL